jgi:hypothetical protein
MNRAHDKKYHRDYGRLMGSYNDSTKDMCHREDGPAEEIHHYLYHYYKFISAKDYRYNYYLCVYKLLRARLQ